MSTEDLKQAGLTEEARRVIDAALAAQKFFDEGTNVFRRTEFDDLLAAVRAYRKSREPAPGADAMRFPDSSGTVVARFSPAVVEAFWGAVNSVALALQQDAAPPESLEPRERYSVRFTQDGRFGRHQVMDDLKNGIAPSIVATCSLSGDAERIARLLNADDKAHHEFLDRTKPC
jgi:hypothetical protein